jgi:phosphatidylserine/phosphatidylglycerophosphate/cardiolipin synthase-like enzyme
VRVEGTVSLAVIHDREHCDRLLDRALGAARVQVWIATANLKEVHLEAPLGTRARARGRYLSIVEIFAELAARGVELRILHGAVPSRRFRSALAAQRRLGRGGLELRHCPRVHLKMIAIDGTTLYLGSANFTGAGLGAKGDGRRNFEAGIVTSDELMLDEMQSVFDAIWSGRRCGACRLRSECPAPLDGLGERPRRSNGAR